ncbi:MAG: hypothetical protein HUJ68_04045 [Clostridia bacterium]|nr:hypothetical protein [Clostridia bacterium]
MFHKIVTTIKKSDLTSKTIETDIETKNSSYFLICFIILLFFVAGIIAFFWFFSKNDVVTGSNEIYKLRLICFTSICIVAVILFGIFLITICTLDFREQKILNLQIEYENTLAHLHESTDSYSDTAFEKIFKTFANNLEEI